MKKKFLPKTWTIWQVFHYSSFLLRNYENVTKIVLHYKAKHSVRPIYVPFWENLVSRVRKCVLSAFFVVVVLLLLLLLMLYWWNVRGEWFSKEDVTREDPTMMSSLYIVCQDILRPYWTSGIHTFRVQHCNWIWNRSIFSIIWIWVAIICTILLFTL